MDINANLNAMGRYGRLARIGAVVCLLVACLLLVVSLVSPTGAENVRLSAPGTALPLS